jgi:hypothetical protein
MVKYSSRALNRTFAALADPTRREIWRTWRAATDALPTSPGRTTCRFRRFQNICGFSKMPDCSGVGAMDAFTKCGWTPNRSNKPRNGSKSIGNSGKARSIGWPRIWTRQPSERKRRRRTSPDVSCMFGKRGLGCSRRSVERRIERVLLRQIS